MPGWEEQAKLWGETSERGKGVVALDLEMLTCDKWDVPERIWVNGVHSARVTARDGPHIRMIGVQLDEPIEEGSLPREFPLTERAAA